MHFQTLSILLAATVLAPLPLLASPDPNPNPEIDPGQPGIIPPSPDLPAAIEPHRFPIPRAYPPSAHNLAKRMGGPGPVMRPKCLLGVMSRHFPTKTNTPTHGASGGAPPPTTIPFSSAECLNGKLSTMTYSLDEALPYVTGVKNGKTLYTTLPPKAKIEMAVCTHCPAAPAATSKV